MPKSCENWLDPANSCIYYAHHIHYILMGMMGIYISQDITPWNQFEDYIFKITATFLRGQWVNDMCIFYRWVLWSLCDEELIDLQQVG